MQAGPAASPPSPIRVELHCHTVHSIDSLMQPERLIDLCRRRGIGRLAVTDHNSIQGAREAAALAPDLVIVGEEIMTSEGELLGYFLQEEVPRGLPPEEAISRLRDQGAFISVSHPCDRYRSGAWERSALDRILPLVDALEVFNARTITAADNRAAEQIAAKAGLMATAGSDAHAYLEVGRSGMRCAPFDDAQGMRRALAAAQVVRRLSPFWVHFLSSYARWRKLRDAARRS